MQEFLILSRILKRGLIIFLYFFLRGDLALLMKTLMRTER